MCDTTISFIDHVEQSLVSFYLDQIMGHAKDHGCCVEALRFYNEGGHTASQLKVYERLEQWKVGHGGTAQGSGVETSNVEGKELWGNPGCKGEV